MLPCAFDRLVPYRKPRVGAGEELRSGTNQRQSRLVGSKKDLWADIPRMNSGTVWTTADGGVPPGSHSSVRANSEFDAYGSCDFSLLLHTFSQAGLAASVNANGATWGYKHANANPNNSNSAFG